MEEVAFFDKTPYEGLPNQVIQEVIANLEQLGKAVIAARDADGRFSANIIGTLFIGMDGNDYVLRGEKSHPGECTCHVHIRWNQICGYALKQEDVACGPEPVVYLLDDRGEPIIRIFYPKRTLAEVEAAPAGEVVYIEPAPRPFRCVFMIRFESENGLQAYVQFWQEMSHLIQQENGARGTQLHRVQGEIAVLAVAEWESKEARVQAYEEMAAKYPLDHKIHWQADRFGGKHIFIVEGDEIGAVFP